MTLFVRGLMAAGLLLGAACSSRNPANSKVAAISTTSAVVIGGVLSPIGRAVHAVTPHERRLPYPAVYDLGGGKIAVTNRTGWFTDRSELSPGQGGLSAWIIDLPTAPRSAGGVIVLSGHNLDRWFLRDHAHALPRPLLYEGPWKGVNTTTGDRVRMEEDRTCITLLLGAATHRFMLSQDEVDPPSPAAPH